MANANSATDDRQSMANSASGDIALGEALTVGQVAAMHAELGRHAGAAIVTLEAGTLQRVDAAGLQLLAAFVCAAESRGARIEWQSPTVALRDGARRLGLTRALHLP